jgi:hypothetical protein
MNRIKKKIILRMRKTRKVVINMVNIKKVKRIRKVKKAWRWRLQLKL